MSDVSDGSGPIPRRSSRVADSAAPVSGVLAIVLAVVAVVLGFLILRSISDGGDTQLGIGTGSAGADVDVASGADSGGTTTVATLPPTTTEAPLVTQGATVVVANANGIGGSAKSMSDALGFAGFTMGSPANKSSAVDVLTVTQILYDTNQPAAQQVADSVARALGGSVEITELQGTPPVESGTIDGAGVLVMLGTDKANKTLEELNPALAAATSATTPIVSNPVAATTTTTLAG